jgi:hypothetical protein
MLQQLKWRWKNKDGKIIAIGKNKSITPAKTIDVKRLIEARIYRCTWSNRRW